MMNIFFVSAAPMSSRVYARLGFFPGGWSLFFHVRSLAKKNTSVDLETVKISSSFVVFSSGGLYLLLFTS